MTTTTPERHTEHLSAPVKSLSRVTGAGFSEMESVRTSGFSYSHQPPLPLTTYGVMVCPAHRRAGADAVWGRGSGYTDAWLFALHHLPVFSCYQVSFLFSSQKKRKPPHFSRSTAMKSDTSGREGGGCLGEGGLKRRLQTVSVGAFWEYSLMRPFASLETTSPGAKQHTL